MSLPYANPDAPKGGRVVMGNTGGFDSLNPFILKGTAPWQLRFLGYESLMGETGTSRSRFTGCWPNRSRPAPTALGRIHPAPRGAILRWQPGHGRGRDLVLRGAGHARGTRATLALGRRVDASRQTGPRSLRITFNTADRELPLIAGLRPILKKAQWQGRDFAEPGWTTSPSAPRPTSSTDYEPGRHVTLAATPTTGAATCRCGGQHNLDEIRIEFFADAVLFEAFKSGELTAYREGNAAKWARDYDFPAVRRGDIVKSEIPHQRPSGIAGYAMNTRKPLFADWRVREAMLLAFNFGYINGTVTGGRQARITSYFSNSPLAMRPGPASGRVRELLEPFADDLPPGALAGYTLPEGDGTARNRGNLRRAARLLREAGWQVQEGRLVDASGRPFAFEVLLRQGDTAAQAVWEIYRRALARLGIEATIAKVDNAQFSQREAALDFDVIPIRRSLSLSPGNEQRLYWGSDGAQRPGTRNLMGVESTAIDAMIDRIVNARAREDFVAATRALDRVLTAGRYVIPIWTSTKDRIAHVKELDYPQETPIYGDRIGWMPDVWWHEEQSR